MSFWTNLDKEPKKQYRFMIEGFGNVSQWWYATSVSKPSVTINSSEHRLINHQFKYPTTGVWNDITVSILDPGDKTKELYDLLREVGYYSPDTQFTRSNPSVDGISKGAFADKFDNGNFVILQLDSSGRTLETWKLYGAFIVDLKFGELDYSSDNFVKIDFTIKYDWARLSTGSDDVQSVTDQNGASGAQ
jgi:hypothetical protein